MYDLQQDLKFSFNNQNKRYFDLSRYEIYVFFNNDSGRWNYEITDNNSLSLKEFNEGGKLIKTNIGWCEYGLVIEILQQQYVDCTITMYASMADWLEDKEAGCWR